MGNTQYFIEYCAQNGARSTYNVWANSESQAIVEFNNWVRDCKRYTSGYHHNFGEIYRVYTH